jgi:hypothetical protein
MKRLGLILAAGLLAFAGACVGRAEVGAGGSAASQAEPDTTCCEVAVTAKLSPQDRCVFDAYRQRCRTGTEREQDLCILRCLAKGPPNIGGGCWHACFAYTGTPWTTPPAAEACDTLAAE